jgi:hypothetical protein
MAPFLFLYKEKEKLLYAILATAKKIYVNISHLMKKETNDIVYYSCFSKNNKKNTIPIFWNF